MAVKESTDTFTYVNANPLNKKAGDCVIRALCLATGKTWEQTYTELFNIAMNLKTVAIGDETYKEFLKQNGFIHCGGWRAERGCKRLTAGEMAKRATGIVVLTVSNHMTVVIDNKIHDIWDCSRKAVCRYWRKQ